MSTQQAHQSKKRAMLRELRLAHRLPSDVSAANQHFSETCFSPIPSVASRQNADCQPVFANSPFLGQKEK
jgi:hypothetical protein